MHYIHEPRPPPGVRSFLLFLCARSLSASAAPRASFVVRLPAAGRERTPRRPPSLSAAASGGEYGDAADDWEAPRTISSLRSAEADPSYARSAFMEAFDDTDSSERDSAADSSEVYDVSWDGPTAADYQRSAGTGGGGDGASASASGPLSRDLSAGTSTDLSPPEPGAAAVAARGRESGYMGDCTLRQIADDYGTPLCYLADVVMDWGAPAPVQPDDRLGDLVTGEQAYAVVEAVNSLDMHEVSERYESKTLVRTAEEYRVPLADAFGFCVREGYNLPFGVHTVLRVVQCQEMLDALCDDIEEDAGGWDGELSLGDGGEVVDYQDLRQEEFY